MNVRFNPAEAPSGQGRGLQLETELAVIDSVCIEKEKQGESGSGSSQLTGELFSKHQKQWSQIKALLARSWQTETKVTVFSDL